MKSPMIIKMEFHFCTRWQGHVSEFSKTLNRIG
jgi:hypothetical protein